MRGSDGRELRFSVTLQEIRRATAVTEINELATGSTSLGISALPEINESSQLAIFENIPSTTAIGVPETSVSTQFVDRLQGINPRQEVLTKSQSYVERLSESAKLKKPSEIKSQSSQQLWKYLNSRPKANVQ